MKKQKKDDEGYYAVSGFASAILVILIHWLVLSQIVLHPTIHVVIGIFLFIIISAGLSPLLSKVW